MNKIYFAGSIRAGREDAELYGIIIDHLSKYGQVLTEHVKNKKLSMMGETEYSGLTESQIYDRDMKALSKSNIVIAEVTKASLGVGFEIGRVIEMNLSLPEEQRKKILCLYRPQTDRTLSAMIAGCDGLKVVEYSTVDGAKVAIDKFFASATER